MYKFITKENVLNLIESVGKETADKSSPNYWRYEDHYRAKPYERAAELIRGTWKAINNGVDPITAIQNLCNRLQTGISVNYLGLILSGLKGEWEMTVEQLRVLKSGVYWVTFEGDFFCVHVGDHLNRTTVKRIANEFCRDEKRRTDGSEKIAAIVPNPITRMKIGPQAL